MEISIITFYTGGRDRYLAQCLDSVYNDLNNQSNYPNEFIHEVKIEHHIVLQGVSAIDNNLHSIIDYFKPNKWYNKIVHHWSTNIGIGAGLNKVLPECKGELIFKMDDDCKIVSSDFFQKAANIHRRFPNSVFSPFPTGLIRNAGGPKGFKHSVWVDKENNEIFTRRHVNHVGGFARFSPAHIIKGFKFPDDLTSGISGTEDGNFSTHCNHSSIEMFYLENGLIVEHNESGLGQIVRYPEYFSGRSWESSLNIEVLE